MFAACAAQGHCVCVTKGEGQKSRVIIMDKGKGEGQKSRVMKGKGKDRKAES